MQSRSAAVHLAQPAQDPATLAPDPDPGPTRTRGRHRGVVDGPIHGLCPDRLGDEATATLLPAPAPSLAPLQQDPAIVPFPTVDLQAGPYRGHHPDEAELAPTTQGTREAQVRTVHGSARRLDQSAHLESGAILARYRGLSHRLDAELRHLKGDATQIMHHGHRHVAVVEVLGMIPARLALHRAGEGIQTRSHGLVRHRLVGVAGRLRGVHPGGRGEDARVTIFSPGIKKQDLQG